MVNKQPTTMSELCEYVKQKRLDDARRHRRAHQNDGLCSGLTDAEYNRVRYPQKKTFSQVRKFTHHRMWKTHSEKYDLKTIKLNTL